VVGSYETTVRIKRHFGRTGLCPKHPLHMSRGWIEVATPIHALCHRGLVAATTQAPRRQMREYHGCFLPREGKFSDERSRIQLTSRFPNRTSQKHQPTLILRTILSEPPDLLLDYTTYPQTARLSKTRSPLSSRARRPRSPICSRSRPTSLWL